MKRIKLLTGIFAFSIASLASANTANMEKVMMHSYNINQEISHKMKDSSANMNSHNSIVREYDKRMRGDKWFS